MVIRSDGKSMAYFNSLLGILFDGFRRVERERERERDSCIVLRVISIIHTKIYAH